MRGLGSSYEHFLYFFFVDRYGYDLSAFNLLKKKIMLK